LVGKTVMGGDGRNLCASSKQALNWGGRVIHGHENDIYSPSFDSFVALTARRASTDKEESGRAGAA